MKAGPKSGNRAVIHCAKFTSKNYSSPVALIMPVGALEKHQEIVDRLLGPDSFEKAMTNASSEVASRARRNPETDDAPQPSALKDFQTQASGNKTVQSKYVFPGGGGVAHTIEGPQPPALKVLFALEAICKIDIEHWKLRDNPKRPNKPLEKTLEAFKKVARNPGLVIVLEQATSHTTYVIGAQAQEALDIIEEKGVELVEPDGPQFNHF